MKSTTVICFTIAIIVLLSINDAEGRRFRRITKPFEKVVKEVGKVGEKVGKEVGRGVEKVGKEIGRGIDKSKDLVKDIVKKPLDGLKKLSYPLVNLLKKRKEKAIEIDENPTVNEENAPDNEPFDVKLLRLHNELRTEANSEEPLKWDNLLQAAAEEWANQCSIGYKVFGDSRDDTYGQNIYPVKEDDAHPYNAVLMWNSFRDSYKEGTFECLENQDCYPYLQMIWPLSKYVGCAVSKCPVIQDISAAGSVLVCFYTPV